MSEASIVYDSYEKIVLCSKKLLFQPYFLSCKIENGFLKQLFSIFLCSNLFSKMEKSCFKKPISFLQVKKKGWKSNFLERNTILFVNNAHFVGQHFWAYSKHVGTPCTYVNEISLTLWLFRSPKGRHISQVSQWKKFWRPPSRQRPQPWQWNWPLSTLSKIPQNSQMYWNIKLQNLFLSFFRSF